MIIKDKIKVINDNIKPFILIFVVTMGMSIYGIIKIKKTKFYSQEKEQYGSIPTTLILECLDNKLMYKDNKVYINKINNLCKNKNK